VVLPLVLAQGAPQSWRTVMAQWQVTRAERTADDAWIYEVTAGARGFARVRRDRGMWAISSDGQWAAPVPDDAASRLTLKEQIDVMSAVHQYALRNQQWTQLDGDPFAACNEEEW
jgi:hypothetical protein